MYITGTLQKHSIQLDCVSWNTWHFLKGTHSNDLQQRETEPKAIPMRAAVGSESERPIPDLSAPFPGYSSRYVISSKKDGFYPKQTSSSLLLDTALLCGKLTAVLFWEKTGTAIVLRCGIKRKSLFPSISKSLHSLDSLQVTLALAH